MSRPKKESKVLNVRLDVKISEELDKFCEETGMSKTNAVERMLQKCLDEYFSKDEKARKLI